MIDSTRVDTRLRMDGPLVFKGVVTFGSRRIHAIQNETVFRRMSYCGRQVENANGSGRKLSCDGCKKALREMGYSG